LCNQVVLGSWQRRCIESVCLNVLSVKGSLYLLHML